MAESQKEKNAEEKKAVKHGKMLDFSHMKKENFVVILLIGVLFLVLAWPTEQKDKNGQENKLQKEALQQHTDSSRELTESFGEMVEINNWQGYVSYLEQTLEGLLSTMEGAGKVKVMITLKDAGETIVEKDITRETGGSTQVDLQGSNNTSDRYELGETVFESTEKGISSPYVKQVISPQIEGVVVSVQGGDNLQINKNITEAIQALFGIDVHKIKIIKMSSKS